MDLTIKLEQEEDERWIAEILNLPGVLAYGSSQEDAVAKVKALAFRVLAEQIEHSEGSSKLDRVAFSDYPRKADVTNRNAEHFSTAGRRA